MNNISFPLINLKLNMSNIAFNICGIEIYWYAIIIVLSIIIAFFWCKKKDGMYEIKFENILELSVVLIPISIICARIYYIMFNMEYFLANPLQTFNIRNGGIAIYGGIIGGVITAYIYSEKKRINILDLLDYIVPSLALGQSIGRWGNFVNVEAYGIETNMPWQMGIVENGITKYVHPTFLYESISTLIIFIVLSIVQKKRKFKGEIVYIYIVLYSFVRFFIEKIRIDSLMLYNFKISQILSLALFIVFSGILSYKIIKCRNRSKKE